MEKEFLDKIKLLRELIRQKGIDGIEIAAQINFSWLTGGRGFVSLASEDSCASIFVSQDEVFLGANNIEAPRLAAEEIALLRTVLPIKSNYWYESAHHAENRRYVRDGQLAKEFVQLRSVLNPDEIARYEKLSFETAKAVEDICKNLKTGISEYEIAGKVSDSLWALGIEPITLLIACDKRIQQYRHPLPTANTLEKYAMVVVCARRHGLVTSLTRLVSHGAVPEELRRKHQAVTAIDACFILNTRPNTTAGQIFSRAVEKYSSLGFGDEWQKHHQGGLTGYSAREYIAVKETSDVVVLNQSFAWNPSITGTKSEDTIIVEQNGNRVLTHTGQYEYLECETGGTKILRPDILII